MSQDRQAILYGLGAVALWSTVATAFKVGLGWMSPLELMWLAALVSWLLMGGLVIRQGAMRQALTQGWRTALWAGVMNPVAYYLVLFAAYDRLPGQEAMALNYTWALAMAFLAVPLLGQRLTRMDVVAGLVAYAGVCRHTARCTECLFCRSSWCDLRSFINLAVGALLAT